jgi:hypothetical protein
MLKRALLVLEPCVGRGDKLFLGPLAKDVTKDFTRWGLGDHGRHHYATQEPLVMGDALAKPRRDLLSERCLVCGGLDVRTRSGNDVSSEKLEQLEFEE